MEGANNRGGIKFDAITNSPIIDTISVELPLTTSSDRLDGKLYGTLMRTPGNDKELIIGPVALKGYNWEEIRAAALAGEDDIGRTGGVFNINLLPGIKMEDEETPFEIEHGGNAFMMIRRDCLQALEPHTPIYTNGGRSLPDGVEIKDYFRVEINKDTNHLLSEDYFFCHSYRQIGGKVWCAPWVETGHFGSHLFNGKYSRTN